MNDQYAPQPNKDEHHHQDYIVIIWLMSPLLRKLRSSWTRRRRKRGEMMLLSKQARLHQLGKIWQTTQRHPRMSDEGCAHS